MSRRGRSTTVGKIAKFYQDRRVSEMRMLGELLRQERRAEPDRWPGATLQQNRPDATLQRKLSPSEVRDILTGRR